MEKIMTAIWYAVLSPGYLYDNLHKQSGRGRDGQKSECSAAWLPFSVQWLIIILNQIRIWGLYLAPVYAVIHLLFWSRLPVASNNLKMITFAASFIPFPGKDRFLPPYPPLSLPKIHILNYWPSVELYNTEQAPVFFLQINILTEMIPVYENGEFIYTAELVCIRGWMFKKK